MSDEVFHWLCTLQFGQLVDNTLSIYKTDQLVQTCIHFLFLDMGNGPNISSCFLSIGDPAQNCFIEE